jgi:flagellar hook assembly protein FlgD
MTVSGKVIRSFNEKITTMGNRSDELNWDGKDERGDRVGRGVYIYELRVMQEGKKPKRSRGKLVLL